MTWMRVRDKSDQKKIQIHYLDQVFSNRICVQQCHFSDRANPARESTIKVVEEVFIFNIFNPSRNTRVNQIFFHVYLQWLNPISNQEMKPPLVRLFKIIFFVRLRKINVVSTAKSRKGKTTKENSIFNSLLLLGILSPVD